MLFSREGDKIMQIHNNYDIEWQSPDGRQGSGVFNGDIGFIEKNRRGKPNRIPPI